TSTRQEPREPRRPSPRRAEPHPPSAPTSRVPGPWGGSAAEAGSATAGAVAGYVAECESRYGGVDAFFNNAAYEGAIAEIPDYPLDEFDRTMAVNVRGVFVGKQHVTPAMRRRGGGSIVNVSSQAGLRGVPGLSAYSASKHAVI